MKHKLLFCLCFSVIAAVSTAQVSAYSFTQSFSSYGSAFTGTDIIGPLYQDDDETVVNLPFTFTFNGTPYNSVEISSNGYITFVPGAGTAFFPLSDPFTTEVASALGQDLETGTYRRGNISNGSNVITNMSSVSGLSVGDSLVDFFGDFGTLFPIITNVGVNSITLNVNAITNATAYDLFFNNGAIREQVAGTTPTRVVTYEFRNFTRYAEFDEYINFKIRLHETTNKIEFCYGSTMSGQNQTYSEIGLKGSSITDFNNRIVNFSIPYIASQTGTIVTDSCIFGPSKFPSGGVTYGWQEPCGVPTFTVAQSSSGICTGQSATLTATGANTYSFIGVGGQSVQVVSPTVTTTYTVVGRAGLCATTLHVIQTVDVLPTLTVNSPSICAGESATLTGSGAQTYTWVGYNPGPEIVVSPTANTIYTLQGSNGGCTDFVTTNVNVTALPNVQVATSNTMACPDQPVTLTANGATSYNWSTGATVAAITVSQPTTAVYTVTGTTNGCSKEFTFTQQVKVCNSIDEISGNHLMKAYPSPFSNELFLVNEGQTFAMVEIRDVAGKLVFAGEVIGSIRVSTEDWSKGMYLVRVSTGDRSYGAKLVKE